MASLSISCPNCSSFSSTSLSSAPSLNRHNPPPTASYTYRSLHSTNSPFLRQTSRLISVTKLQAQLSEVAVKESSNSIPKPAFSNSSPAVVPDADSINAFIAQVSDLVKLVDSRDIVELELKQQDCELLIRKKEAIPLSPAPVTPLQPSYYAAPLPPQAQAPAAAPPALPSSAARALPALPAPPAKASVSSHPPLKCPMAGTFYRCPGPGEPPFVKVGDKVQKGQVICIIEAMKLMNEIEADQSGTIAEILVEDGKPVSVDLPLFVIAP